MANSRKYLLPKYINENFILRAGNGPFGIYDAFSFDILNIFDFHSSFYAFTYGSMIKARFMYNVTDMQPDTTYAFIFANLSLVELNKLEVPGYDKSLYQERTLYAPTKDGYSVPIELAYRCNFIPISLNFPRVDQFTVGIPKPLLLQAYGAYGDNNWVYFDQTLISLMDRGTCRVCNVMT